MSQLLPKIKPLASALAALALVLLFAVAAFAHAQPQKYEPAPGSRLSVAPTSVQIWFDQRIEPDLSRIQVLNRAKNRVDVPDHLMLSDNDQHATVPLLVGAVKPGVYTVLWRVVSAEDGHLTKGTFAFVVEGAASTPIPAAPAATVAPGQPSPTPEPTVEASASVSDESSTDETAPSPLDVAIRWLSFALAAMLIGGAAFVGLVHRPTAATLDDDGATTQRYTHAFIIFGIVLGFLLVLVQGLELLAQTARINEADIGTVLGSPATIGAVLGSSFGTFLKLRLACALAIPAILFLAIAFGGGWEQRIWPLVVLLGAGYYAAEAMSGHEAAVASATNAGLLARLAPLSDWLHLMATAVWLGGLVFFLVIILPQLRHLGMDERRLYLSGAISRFSPLALVCVVLLIISGSVSMFAHDTTLDTLLNTDWGHYLLFKVALLALLIGMGALNLFVTRPRLAALQKSQPQQAAQMSRTFRWLMGGEVTLAAAVLVFAALLTLSPPALTTATPSSYNTALVAPTATIVASTTIPATATPPNQATATPAPPVVISQTVRGMNVQLATRSSPDEDQFRIQLRDASGKPYPNVSQVAMRLTLLDLNGNPSGTDTLLADDNGGGNFAIPDAPYLTLAGDWQAVIVARVKDQPNDVKAAFILTLADNGTLTAKTDEYLTATILTDPSPAVSGEVKMTVKLADAEGRAVNDATLTVQCIMPAHGHIADPLTPAPAGAGTYSGKVFLRMSGAWSIQISVARPGKSTTVTEASMDVEPSNLDLTPYPSPQFTPQP